MFFPKMLQARITKEEYKNIKKILRADKGKRFESISHYVRCAIIEKNRKEGKIK